MITHRVLRDGTTVLDHRDPASVDVLVDALVAVEESKLLPGCVDCDHDDDDVECCDTSLGCEDAAAIRAALADEGAYIVDQQRLAEVGRRLGVGTPERWAAWIMDQLGGDG